MDSFSNYISNPKELNRETLYELRLLVGRYPYFDAARLLMLKNLYLLHDIEFGKELRKAALYLKNRRVLFELMEGYGAPVPEEAIEDEPALDRTMTLIDAFLDTLPKDKFSLEAEGAAAIDYASAYLKEPELDVNADMPRLRGQELIDDFLSAGNEKISLQLRNESEEQLDEVQEEKASDSSFFTETLAAIYIKQGKYDKALEIIRRLCLEYPNKNRYFADQIRFLEKIVKHTKRE